MSLLLEALKKAEKAKEEAQRRARGDTGAAAPGSAPLELQEDAPRAELRPGKPVLTRAELPDISQPLEILSEDLGPRAGSGTAERRAAGARAAQAQPPQVAGRDAGREAQAQPSPERTAARKVFEVKFKEPNPRLPFYLTVGALGLFAMGTVGYFWYQLRPPQSLVNLAPSPNAQREVVASSPAPAPAVPATSSPAQAAIPGMPAVAGAASPRPSGSPTPAIPRASLQPPAAPLGAEAAGPPVARQGLTLRSSSASTAQAPEPARAAPQVHPKVEAAYAAYRTGDIETARTNYQDALRDDPANRDALLGLAAVDVRSGRLEAAEATYLRLLRADPRDAHAQAALIALRGARLDPLVTESRLKNLLASDPGAHVLNFTLGNQLAQQGRWGEAQQEYFKAFAAEPDNADFAYNLAVSLDHLRQPKLALDYYQRALALAVKRGASFDAAAARARVAQLGG